MRHKTWSEAMRDTLQEDLFPNRSTVGQEIVAELLIAPSVSTHSTEIKPEPNGTSSAKWQRRLPFNAARR